jgi:hypothetical protein
LFRCLLNKKLPFREDGELKSAMKNILVSWTYVLLFYGDGYKKDLQKQMLISLVLDRKAGTADTLINDLGN